jgi:hypothetical protein
MLVGAGGLGRGETEGMGGEAMTYVGWMDWDSQAAVAIGQMMLR